MFFSKENGTATSEVPSFDREFSSSMPEMVLIAPSILSVTSVSISSGAAPGSLVVTMITGKSMLGNSSSPSLVYPAMPTTRTRSISTVAKMGRRTHTSASHCISVHRLPVAEGIRRLDDDLVAGAQTAKDRNHLAVVGAGLNDPLVEVAFGDHEHVGPTFFLDQRPLGRHWRVLGRGLGRHRREHAGAQQPFGVGHDGLGDQIAGRFADGCA